LRCLEPTEPTPPRRFPMNARVVTQSLAAQASRSPETRCSSVAAVALTFSGARAEYGSRAQHWLERQGWAGGVGGLAPDQSSQTPGLSAVRRTPRPSRGNGPVPSDQYGADLEPTASKTAPAGTPLRCSALPGCLIGVELGARTLSFLSAAGSLSVAGPSIPSTLVECSPGPLDRCGLSCAQTTPGYGRKLMQL
jgi:hypothetical protein